MENFRTIIKNHEFEPKMTYKNKTMFIGSCFTENIGNYFTEFLFNTDVNPFGVLYNPISIKNSLEILINSVYFTETDLLYNNNMWFSYSHHSKFSHSNKDECLRQINARIKKSSDFLRKTDYLFITFGTSWIYNLSETADFWR